jgi:hypothetical protein
MYIYSLYIKSPGIPVIEEAQASQYALLVEPNLVSIYLVTVSISHARLPLVSRFPKLSSHNHSR